MSEHFHNWEADLDENQDPIYRRRLGLLMASFHCKNCSARTWMTDSQFDVWFDRKQRIDAQNSSRED